MEQSAFPAPPTRGSSKLTELTARANELMKCFAKGLLYKEAADKLGISTAAVHKLQHKIYVKLQVANRTEAIARWRGENWR